MKGRENIFAPIYEKSPCCALAKKKKQTNNPIFFFFFSAAAAAWSYSLEAEEDESKGRGGRGPRARSGSGMWDVGAAAGPWLSAPSAAPSTALAAHLSLHSGKGLQGGWDGDGEEGKGEWQGSCAAQRRLSGHQWPESAQDSLRASLCQPGHSSVPARTFSSTACSR